ncbi:pyruvate dehydrogenase E2 component (dihydrolipoamide acetyltransferase) [Paucimonas lemoignei]|uniref:Dihydrolipoamide acetyltransferase component of pyruvate dehydrogenase complex n=1 Tax=Paucimonas lemoignei TaxID=29443 RepID=A0A4R3HQK5_PAULE|nr:dihydrolipoamide acetyltransferase family protein [Paucimonas lemoignei]TCS34047.1 pyruvate dehydrogenase E2 component (dihydrolipoamide acetyltransferase) [Paucimonas lemoignei]
MKRKLLMPKLGLTMTEGVIAEWSIPVGGTFKTDDVLFVVETDKVANEIPAESSGVLTEVVAKTGQTVAVGEVIGYWDDGIAGEEPAVAPGDAGGGLPPHIATHMPAPAPALQGSAGEPAARVRSSPMARRIAAMENVDLAVVTGTGPRNAVRAQDVRDYLQARAAAVPAPASAAQPMPAPTPVPSSAGAGGIDAGERIKPSLVQAATARRLTAVKQQVPHFYLAVEAEVSKLLALRAEINAQEPPVRLTINHFVVAAVGRALLDLPDANAVWADGEILRFSSADVGVAVNSDKGLFVPVLRDAGRLSLNALALASSRLVERARAGALTAAEMQGGAITVSNAGMFNVKFMTPIINPGQAMILGVGSISRQFRPDAEGRPALTQEMGLVLAGDHRLLDGVSGLRFLNRVTHYLERPLLLMLGHGDK